MLKKVFLALLIVGSSSVALAQPAVRDHRFGYDYQTSASNQAYDRYDDGRYHDGRHLDDGRDLADWRDSYHPRFERHRMAWAALSSPVRLSDDRERRVFINVADQMRPLRTLRLEAVDGATYVFQVAIEFKDGRKTMKLRPNVVLGRRNPALQINLGDVRSVHRIIVYGHNYDARSSFVVTGV